MESSDSEVGGAPPVPTIRVEAEEEKKVDPVRVAMHPDVQRLRSDLPANASDQSQKAGQTPLMPRRVVHVRVGSAAGGRSPYLPRDAMHSPTTRRMHGSPMVQRNSPMMPRNSPMVQRNSPMVQRNSYRGTDQPYSNYYASESPRIVAIASPDPEMDAPELERTQLTPYEDWTSGELRPRQVGIDIGLRARHARENAPGGAQASAWHGTGLPEDNLTYLGPTVVPGETKEQRDMRLFLARGEGAAEAHQLGIQTPLVERKPFVDVQNTAGPISSQFERNSVYVEKDAIEMTGPPETIVDPDTGAQLTEALQSVPAVDLFQGVSAKARTIVYQYIWELKLRAFTEGEVLEQELRKDPERRVFLKLVQPTSLDTIQKRKYQSSKLWRLFRLVDGTMPKFSRWAAQRFPTMLIDSLLRGAGQNMMANNPIAGLIAIAAIFAADVWVACMACLGLLCSTLAALFLGVNRAALQGGLFGYNGLLIGAALAVLMEGSYNPRTIPLVIIGSAFTSIGNLALGNILAPVFGAPPLALAFVFVTWIIVGASFSWTHFTTNMTPMFPGPVPVPVTFDAAQAFQGWMRGIGAMYFAGETWSGCMIVVGMAFFSRISAAMMLMGSLVGIFAAYAAGVDVAQIYSGGYSYDAALTAIGVGGLFFVISWKVAVLAVLAAWFSAWLHSFLQMALIPAGLPALNLAFDLTVILFVMIQFSLSGISVIPLAKISQPEAHLRSTRALARTLKALAAIETAKLQQFNRRLIEEQNDVRFDFEGGGANTDYETDDLSL